MIRFFFRTTLAARTTTSQQLAISQRSIFLTSAFLHQRGGAGGYQGNNSTYQRGYNNGGGQKQRQQQYDGSGNSRGSYGGQRGGGSNYPPSRQQQRPGQSQRPDAPRRPEQFLAENAQSLLEMKSALRKATSERERAAITMEARRLIRRVRIDPSTQDEKSAINILNCAVAFRSRPAEAVLALCQWCRSNVSGLAPQNVALYANALGTFSIPERDVILLKEVSPVVQAVLKEMTPVEVIMVLQAFGRAGVKENAALQDLMLKQLASCIEELPSSQLSTLSTVLAGNSLKERDPEAWRGLVVQMMQNAMSEVETMHSKDAITFLLSAPLLDLPPEQLCGLIRRVIAAERFHTDEQVADLLLYICRIQSTISDQSPELRSNVEALKESLIRRLDRVSNFVSLVSAKRIWSCTHIMGLELPLPVMGRMEKAIVQHLAYESARAHLLADLVREVSFQKLTSLELLNVVSDYSVGIKPPRTGSHIGMQHTTESIGSSSINREHIYGHYFGEFVQLRLALEHAFSTNGATTVPPSLATELPRELVKHVYDASPRHVLIAIRAIYLSPDCALRNHANDKEIVDAVMAGLRNDSSRFTEQVSPETLTRTVERLSSIPEAQSIVALLKSSV